MNGIAVSPATTLESDVRVKWDRMLGETHKAYAAFVIYRDLGPERTYRKVAEALQKSEPLIARWAVRFNWKNRAAEYDDYNDQALQRERLKLRLRFQDKALKIANKLHEKVEHAVDVLELTKIVNVNGNEKEEVIASPNELVRLLELSQEIQKDILGDASEDRVAAIHVNFNAYLPEFDYEQPENVQARRKAELEAHHALHD